jgi:hypothetical protein
VALFACSALTALLLGGCGTLSAAFTTSAILAREGFQNVNIDVATGSAEPVGGVVNVSFSRGPTGNDQQDAQEAARTVWRTLRLRFGELVITRQSGGCTGPVCASRGVVIETATYA